jgi:hypothetical protein
MCKEGPLGPGLGTPHLKNPSHMLIFLWCDVRDVHGKILHAHDQTLKPPPHHSHHQTLNSIKHPNIIVEIPLQMVIH